MGADEVLADLLDEALYQYKKDTGIDLGDETSPLHRRLSVCSDYRSIIDVLDEIAEEFEEYRHPARNRDVRAKIRNALRPIVRALLRIGVLDVAGEVVASQGVGGGKVIFVAIGILLKAIEGVTARFDAVAALLTKFKFYLERLNVRSIAMAFGSESRALAVALLVDMLTTLASATKMVRQNRLRHFFNVLVGGEDDIGGISKHTKMLMQEADRLTLTEVQSGLSDLNAHMREALLRTETDIRTLVYDVSRISSTVAEQAAQTRSAMHLISRALAELPGRIQVNLATRALSSKDTRSSTSDSAIGIPPTIVNSFVATVSMPCSDLPSFLKMSGDLVNIFHRLSPEEQASLKRGIAHIYATAATSITGCGADNAAEVMIASFLDPGPVMVLFLPMALAFIAVFLFWKSIASQQRMALPRGVDIETIFLVDVLGSTFVLPLNICTSWDIRLIWLGLSSAPSSDGHDATGLAYFSSSPVL